MPLDKSGLDLLDEQQKSKQDLRGPISGLSLLEPTPTIEPALPEPKRAPEFGAPLGFLTGVPFYDEPAAPVSTEVSRGLPKVPGERHISAARPEYNYIERALRVLGLGDVVGQLSEDAKAQAVVERMAREANKPLHEFRRSPELVEQAASGFLSTYLSGLVPATVETITGEKPPPPTSVTGYVGYGLGHLAGFLTPGGPVSIVSRSGASLLKQLPKRRAAEIEKFFRVYRGDKLSARILKSALRDSIVLGPAVGLASLGEAAKETTFAGAASRIGEGIVSGAITGTIFGLAKGLFPGNGVELGARLITGMIGLNAQRAVELGPDQFTNRDVGEVIFDLGLDALFLWRGLPARRVRKLTKDIEDVTLKRAEIKQKEDLINTIPDEAIKQAQIEVLKAQRIENELKAKEAVEDAENAIASKQETEVKSKELKDVKQTQPRPKRPTKKELIAETRKIIEAKEEAKLPPKTEPEKPETLAKGPFKGIEEPTEAQKRMTELAKEAVRKRGVIEEPVKVVEPEPTAEPAKPEALPAAPEIKPTVSVEPEILVTSKQINEIEKYFGKNFEDIPSQDIAKFLEGEAPKVELPKVEPKVVEPAESDIEKFYGKKAEELTEAEIDKFYGLEEKVPEQEPLTEVDVQTKAPRLPELTDDNSPLRQTSDVTAARKLVYEKSKSVATSVDDLLNQLPDRPIPDPGVTYWKLVNDVNRWLDGEKIDIIGTRDFLSELAARADEFKYHFVGEGYPESFYQWKESVSEAADWARKADRPKFDQSATRDIMGNLNLFIDPTKAPAIVRELFESIRKIIPESKTTADRIWRRTGFFFNPHDSKWRFEIDDSKLKFNTSLESIVETVPSKGIINEIRVGDLIDYPDLFRAHPEAADIKFRIERPPILADLLKQIQGRYDDVTNTLTVTPYAEDKLNTVVHELQHYIQFKSGFATGGTVSKAIDSAKGDIIVDLADKLVAETGKIIDTEKYRFGKLNEIIRLLSEVRSDPGKSSRLDDLIRKDRELFNSIAAASQDQKTVRKLMNDNYLVAKEIHELLGVDDFFASSTVTVYLGDIARISEEAGRVRSSIESKLDLINKILTNKEESVLRGIIKDAGSLNYYAYSMLAGEIEARDVGARVRLTEAERREIPPLTSEEFKSEHVIVHFESGAKSMSELPPDTRKNKLRTVFHGTSSKYVKPENIVGGYLKPRSLEQIIVDVLDKLNLTGITRDRAKDRIYDHEYFKLSLAGEGRPFKDELIFVARDFGDAVEYAKFAGEAYDNALIALGALDKNPSGVALKAKVIYDANRSAKPYVLEVEYTGEIKEGDIVSNKPLKVRSVYDESGTKLYAGFPFDKTAEVVRKILSRSKTQKVTRSDLGKLTTEQRAVVEKALDYKEAFERDEAASKEAKKLTLGERKKLIAEGIWDTKHRARKALVEGIKAGELDEQSTRVLWKMINESGGHAYGQKMFMQFDKEVFGGLSNNGVSVLNKLTRGKRVTDIASYKAGVKFPEGQSPANSATYEALFGVLEDLKPGEDLGMIRRRDAYFEWMKKLVDVREQEGIISSEMADGLRKHDYAKFRGIGQRLEKGEGVPIELLYDEKETVTIGGRARSVNSSGIESLQKGRLTDILETDQRLVALEIFNRVYGQAFRNRTFVELADMAYRNPKNSIVKLTKKDAHPDQDPIVDARLWTKFNYRVGGQRKTLYLDSQFARGLEAAGKDISPRAIRWANYITLAPITKAMLTGAAPLWSLFVNLPRDIMHAHQTAGRYKKGEFGQIYSSHPPVFFMQLGRDFKSTFYDTFLRNYKSGEREKYMRAAERGLLMPFLSTQARTSVTGYKLPGRFAPLENFFMYASESLEMWTRMAIAERVVRQRAAEAGISVKEARKNNDVMDEAVFVARDYLDFQQGGWFTKMLDKLGLIYLSAGVQAIRSFGRSMIENPQQAIARVVQTVGIPTVLVVAASKLYSPETSDDIPEYLEDNNLVIPFPDSFRFIDSAGQENGLALTIPLDSGAAFFKNLFRGLTQKFMYETGVIDRPPDYQAILGSLTKAAPDIMSLPPAQRAAFEYMLNIDFWTRKHITPETFSWPKSAEEFTKGRTSEMAIDVGQVTKLSPDRLEAVKRSLLGDNIWTYAVGAGYDEAFGDIPKEMQEEHLALILSKVPGIKRFIRVVKSGTDIMEKQGEILEDTKFNDFVNSGSIDYYSKAHYWYGVKGANDKLMEHLNDKKKVPTLAEQERLIGRAEFISKIKDLPNRATWVRMWSQPAEAKARDYLDRLDRAKTEAQKESLSRQLSVVLGARGYAGPEFFREVERLRAEQEQVR